MDNIEFINKISRKVNVNDDIEELALYKAKEIVRNGQEKNRTRDTIYNQCLRGLISEVAVADILECDFNSLQVFNLSNPHSYAYDLVTRKNGKTVEVKTLSEDNSHSGWLNVNQEKFKNRDQLELYGSYPDVQTALNNSDIIDYIVFCTNVNNVVTIKYLFKMEDFKKHLQLSRYLRPAGNSTHYLNPKPINLIK